MSTRIKLRRGTAAQWTAQNPILSSGEVGYETDTGKFKIGNGATAWTSNTSYFQSSTSSGATQLDELSDVTITSAANDDILQRKAGVFVNRTIAQYKSDLSLNNVENTALSTWVGTANLTTLGTISTGDWHGTVIDGLYGGTGVANNGKTITLGGNLTLAGAFALTLTQTAITNVTLPTTGTLATLAGTETLTNKTLTSPTVSGLYVSDASIVFEGTTADAFETTLTVTDPTADRTITLPNATGTVALLSSAQSWTAQQTFINSIVLGAASTATGQIDLKGVTSGTVTLKTADAAGTYTLTLPTDDGTSNQVLTTDGSGVLSWTTASGSTYNESNPVNDTSTNQLLEFAKTTSAVNHWKMTNNSTGNAPILTAGGTGSDANLDGIIQASGTGKISILGASLNISSDSSWSSGDTFKLGFGAGSEAGYLSGGWGLAVTLYNAGGTQLKLQTNTSNTLITDVVNGDYAQFSNSATAGHTKFLVYDVDNGQLERVSVGAADSGGTGFKVLRIPN